MTLDHNVARRRERTLCLLILLAGTMLKLIYALQVSCYVSPHDLGRLSDWVQRTNGHLGYIQYLYQYRHLLQTSPVGAGQFYHPPLFYLVGAAVMAPVFCRELGLWKGLWYSVFHAISAFCNAGFDLMGYKARFSSLTSFATQPVINVTIMFLIVFGGIGFLTWDDIRTNRLHLHKYRMQSKVILCTTAVLLIVPAMYFYFFEFADLTRKERLLSSLFQAVTPRTAGFNTVELTNLSEAGQFITIALMLIGGSPGSTAGGLKTTTIAVLLTTAISTFRRRENAHLFGRRIDDDIVKNAATISLMYITLCCTGGLIISVSEGLPMLTCLFETASAVGTVGLSLGITPELNLLSRSVLILLMFFGRVGGLTLIFAALSSAQKKVSKLPKEKITVG